MKTILAITLMLVGIGLEAQQVFLLDTVKVYNPSIDSVYLHQTVMYDAEFRITSFKNYTENTGEVAQKHLYENDTIVQYIHVNPADTGNIHHHGDTILFLMTDRNRWYRVNEAYQTVETNYGNTMLWENDNLVERYVGENLMGEFSYFDFNNPYFNVWKTYRISNITSYNQVEFEDYQNGYDYRYEVVGSENNYPTEIKKYLIDQLGNEIHLRTYYYYYQEVMDVTEIPEYYTVFSISYFNLLGQQIKKPKHGFYIERKVTKKGIISTKYFIQ